MIDYRRYHCYTVRDQAMVDQVRAFAGERQRALDLQFMLADERNAVPIQVRGELIGFLFRGEVPCGYRTSPRFQPLADPDGPSRFFPVHVPDLQSEAGRDEWKRMMAAKLQDWSILGEALTGANAETVRDPRSATGLSLYVPLAFPIGEDVVALIPRGIRNGEDVAPFIPGLDPVSPADLFQMEDQALERVAGSDAA